MHGPDGWEERTAEADERMALAYEDTDDEGWHLNEFGEVIPDLITVWPVEVPTL